MEWNFNCYDCGWLSDKCKNPKSNRYNEFPTDIKECNIVGKVDNSLGCSLNNLKDDNM